MKESKMERWCYRKLQERKTENIQYKTKGQRDRKRANRNIVLYINRKTSKHLNMYKKAG